MEWFQAPTTLALGGLFGGILAFSALFAPLVFTKLPVEQAGPFIRAVFPWYYLYVIVFGFLSAIFAGLAGAGFWVLFPSALVGLASVYTRQVLMLQINELRDRELAGDKAAGGEFNTKHRLSVIINSVQLFGGRCGAGLLGMELRDHPQLRLLEQTTVAQTYPLFFVNYAVQRGFAAEQVLEHTGISLQQLQVPNGRIAAAQHGLVVMNLLALFQSEHIAIDIGLQSSLTKAGMIGFGLMSCASLREAIELGIRFLPTKVPFYTIDTSEDERTFVCHIREAMPLEPVRQFAIENFVIEVWRLFESLFNPMGNAREASGIELWFDWPEPAYYGSYASSLPKCRFNAAGNQIRIPAKWLDLPLPTANATTAQMVIQQCEQELIALGLGDNLSGRVKNLLICRDGNYPQLEGMAQTLHMSVRTLKRKLQHEGRSFSGLLGEVVQRDACLLLETTRLNVDEIAQRVGYQDRANFTRAFKKLTGKTPSEYRECVFSL